MTETADTRWLSDTELAAWIPFSGMLIGLLSALDTQLRDAKLSLFGYLVLAALSEAPERTLAMSDLAVRAGGSLSRLSHAVSALERQGWVKTEWKQSENNQRAKYYSLTVSGRKRLTAEQERWNKLSAAIANIMQTRGGEA